MTEASADVIAQLNSIISRIPGNNTQKDELQTTMILLKSMMDNYQKNVKTLRERKHSLMLLTRLMLKIKLRQGDGSWPLLLVEIGYRTKKNLQ